MRILTNRTVRKSHYSNLDADRAQDQVEKTMEFTQVTSPALTPSKTHMRTAVSTHKMHVRADTIHIYTLHVNIHTTSLQMFRDFNDALEDICNNDLPADYTQYCQMLMRLPTWDACVYLYMYMFASDWLRVSLTLNAMIEIVRCEPVSPTVLPHRLAYFPPRSL